MATYLCRGPRIGWTGGAFLYRDPESGKMVPGPEIPVLTAEQAEAAKLELVRGGQVEKAIAAAFDDLTRKPCGTGLDELINDLPADGKLHELQCPTCGNPFKSGREASPEPVEG